MLENVLKTRNLSLKAKITLKFIVAVSVVAMAVVLPQIVHAAAGSEGGAAWLPMYLPVLLGGDRKSTRLNSSHSGESRMPSSA